MSTAAQAGTSGTTESTVAPGAPAEVAPPVPVQETPLTPGEQKPDVPQEKPSGTGKEGGAPVEGLTVAPAQAGEQMTQKDDNNHGAGTVSQGNSDTALATAGFVGSTSVGVLPGLSRLTGSHAPNYKADVAILVSILSLALAGVWIEWRFLGRQPV